MVGLKITTGSKTGPAAGLVDGISTLMVAGICDDGPAGLTGEPAYALCRSLDEFRATFGPRSAAGFLDDAARIFFAEQFEGSAQLAVARVAGSAAAKATVNLQNATPAAAVRVDARYVGSSPNGRIGVQPVAGSSGGLITINVFDGATLVESFPDNANPAAIAAALAASAYVRGVDLGAVAGTNPIALGAPVTLSGGVSDSTGGTAPTAAQLVAALARFGPELGSGVVAIPGYPASLVGAGIKTHADAYSRVGYTAAALGTLTPAAAKAAAAAMLDVTVGKSAGLVWPEIIVRDGSVATRAITPESFLAACRARLIAIGGGPWEVPAGELAGARSPEIVGLGYYATAAENDDLDAGSVTVIRRIGGGASAAVIEPYGYHSLYTTSPGTENLYLLLKEQDVCNFVVQGARAILRRDTWRTVDSDSRLLGRLEGELRGFLISVRNAGGIYALKADDGTLIDDGFSVDCGPGLNTRSTLSQNRLRAAITLRTTPTAAQIELMVTMASLNVSV